MFVLCAVKPRMREARPENTGACTSKNFATHVPARLNSISGRAVSRPDQLTIDLFKAGGDWRQADKEDIAIFELHGLIRSASHNEFKSP